MYQNLRRIFVHVIDDVDIYITIAVAAALAASQQFHLIGNDVEISDAILGVLILVAINSLQDRRKIKGLYDSQDRLAALITQHSDDPGVRWYSLRNESDEDMFNDLKISNKIVFLGASQRSLADYLYNVLTRYASLTLPWQGMEVYFAAPEVGALTDESESVFKLKVRAARQSVAACLTKPAYAKVLPSFQGVQFFQLRRPMAYSGAMLSAEDTSTKFEVIYVVHSEYRGADFKRDMTVRFSSMPTASFGKSSAVRLARIAHYTTIYENISRESTDLGFFQRSIWDDSAEEWSRFVTKSPVLVTSMSELAQLSDISPDERILDLGAGPGDTSEILVKTATNGRVTILDASPQMTARARDKFARNTRVNIALCEIRPDLSATHIDLVGNEFSLIVVHQSFGNLVSSFANDCGAFAHWCFRSVLPGGRVIIAAHNTVVETEKPTGWEGWEDKFKSALYREIDKIPRWRGLARPRRRHALYKRVEIEGAFSSQGFTLEWRQTKIIEMTMEDRILMWQVPAVMNDIVNVGLGGKEPIPQICSNLREQFSGPTMPQTVTYWMFRRN